MKALRKLEKKEGLWLDQLTVPQPGIGEVLIEIATTAICGTDIHIYNWDQWAQQTIPVPLTTGHEFVGVIQDMGPGVHGYAVGDRVSGEGHVTCGYCRNCRAGRRHLCRDTQGIGVQIPGAFAEYMVLPAFNLCKIPDDIPNSFAAILDPFGNAAHCALEFDLAGEDVLITGAGPIGLMTIRLARFLGARHIVITDVNHYRLHLAKELGATRAIHALDDAPLTEVMTDLGMTEGFDVGFEMSGHPTAFQDMLSVMSNGGSIAFLGIPSTDFGINWHDVVFKSLTIKGIYGRRMFETWYKMIQMIQSGLDLTPFITHEFPVDDFQTAFDTLRTGDACKVLINW